MTDGAVDLNRPIAVFDTSGIIDLMWASVRYEKRKVFEALLRERVGGEPQCGYHPVTLAELASNTHEEVFQSRSRGGFQQRSQVELRENTKKFRRALEALEHSLRGEWAEVLPFQMHPLTPSLSSYVRLSRQRADFRNLRCLRKSGVVPLASMVDHQILSLAFFLRERGTDVTFVTGDRELLGAAEGLGMSWINSREPTRTEPPPWKDCARDEACIAGCFDGVAACDVMFARAPAVLDK